MAQHPISFFFESPRHAEPAISLSGTHESSTASDGFSVLHDVLAEGGDDVHQLLMLSCRHLVLVKGLREVANNNVEVGVGDPEPGVHRLRRAADHLAWASGNIAHQVLVLLFETFARVRAHTDKELANCWIREQPVCEVVDDFRDGVVAAEPLIERALRLAASRFRLAATRLCLAASRRCVREHEGQAQQQSTNEGNDVDGHTYLQY